MITLLGTLLGLYANNEELGDFEMENCYDTPESRTLITCLGGIFIVEVFWMTIKNIYKFIRKK